MIDKKLFGLIAGKTSNIRSIAILNIIGLLLNVAFSALVCYSLYNISITASSTLNTILFAVLALVLVVGFRFVVSYLLGKIKAKLGDEIKVELREKLLDKSLALGVSRKNYISDAGISQVSIEGVEQLDMYFTNFIPSFIYGMAAPIILFIIAVFIEWKTALVLLVALPLIPFTIMKVSAFAKKTFGKYWGRYTSMGDCFLDSLEGMKELKIFDADEEKQKEINVSSEEFRKITMKVLVMQLWSLTIMDVIAYGGAAIAIIVTLFSAQAGAISAFAGLFLVLLCADFFLPMRALGSAFHVAMNGATAGKKILSLLEVEESAWGERQLEKIETIEIRDLTFSYDESRTVLENFNLKLVKGLNSVVGESGCGKSTIASLLLAKYKTDSVFINGHDLFSYKKRAFFDKINYVGADSLLFNRSVRENFQMVNDNVTDDEIYEKLKMVRMDEYIKSIGGLDYVILENSENISGGQRQRVILACNLTKARDFYIFDEATSNIDIDSEKIIVDIIYEIARTKIVLMISHRLNNVVNSANINYIADKTVSESGKHGELIELGGKYKNSYNYQNEQEKSYLEVTNEA